MRWLRLNAEEQQNWSQFVAGDRVDITLEFEGVEEVYSTVIESVSEKILSIRPPRLGSAVLEVMPKIPIKVSVLRENGIFKFSSNVIAQSWDRGGFIEINRPRSITHIQRRQYFRLPILLPLKYGVILAHEAGFDANVEMNNPGITKDISEGGLQMVVDKPLQVGALLKIQVELDANVSFGAVATVLGQKEIGTENKYIIRSQFIRITEETREMVRRFILTHSHLNK
jgi:c-di-GMP-binding flagellar brake protein YcgR